MRRLLLPALVALMVLTIAPVAAETGSPPPDPFPNFTADLDQARAALAIPGMAVAVVEDGQVVYARGFGWADIERGIPATPDTPFGLASVTKPIGATVVMQMVEEGLIDLDAPINQYGVSVDGSPSVTVRHLLTHTSGDVPGTTHNYDGNRYRLLGGVIEGASGRTFATELTERILIPLDMTDTALNPINSGGDTSLHGFEDFQRSLGWGSLFSNYPDVYRRAARPYQFDEDYSIIPGMSHLTHSPAAGLLSSVTDLAAFDMALERGDLLDAATRQEMLTSAYSIPGGRTGSGYGLGWYVQDFQGMSIEWHTGRWPPSTSALYARFPDSGRTLIVLANTDNLTVPFYGLGHGDVMHSLLTLVFYRHFMYPSIQSNALPEVDWSAPAADIEATLSGEADPVALEFLERELWAYRQAYGSSGEVDQVEELTFARVALFPASSLRTDLFFTALAGPPTVLPPVLSATTLGTISLVVLIWLMVIAASLLAMIGLLLWRRTGPPEWWILWPLAAVFVGPVAPIVFALALPEASRRRQRAFAAATVATGAYGVAWTLAVHLLVSGGNDPGPAVLLAIYCVPLLVGLLLISVLHRTQAGSYLKALRSSVVTGFTTMHLAVGVLFGAILTADNRLLSTIPHPGSPYFWGMMGLASLLVLALLGGLLYWIDRRGFAVWPAPVSATAAPLPAWRDSWWMIIGSFAVMLCLMALAAVLTG